MHLTQIVNNKIHKIDLCESCAQKKGVTDPEGFSLADLLSKSDFTPTREVSETGIACPNCGHDLADFRRTGRLGCAVCYQHFADHVRPVLEDMHFGTTHKGKVPKFALQRLKGKARLEELQAALERAVAEEAYEEAAKFRDQIRQIEADQNVEVFQA